MRAVLVSVLALTCTLGVLSLPVHFLPVVPAYSDVRPGHNVYFCYVGGVVQSCKAPVPHETFVVQRPTVAPLKPVVRDYIVARPDFQYVLYPGTHAYVPGYQLDEAIVKPVEELAGEVGRGKSLPGELSMKEGQLRNGLPTKVGGLEEGLVGVELLPEEIPKQVGGLGEGKMEVKSLPQELPTQGGRVREGVVGVKLEIHSTV